MSSNPAHDEVFSIQQYEIKFVSDFRHADGFFLGILVSSTKILLKVALNTITQPWNLAW